MGLLDEFQKKTGLQVPNVILPAGLPNPTDLIKKGTDFAKEKTKDGTEFAADKAMAGARMVAVGRLPDQLDLSKSKTLTQYVEKGLMSLGAKGIKPDGTPDAATLDALNAVIGTEGRQPLKSLNDFTKDDLKALNEALDKAGHATPPNMPARNVLNTGGDIFVAAQKDYPQPKPERSPSADPGMQLGGGGGG